MSLLRMCQVKQQGHRKKYGKRVANTKGKFYMGRTFFYQEKERT